MGCIWTDQGFANMINYGSPFRPFRIYSLFLFTISFKFNKIHEIIFTISLKFRIHQILFYDYEFIKFISTVL